MEKRAHLRYLEQLVLLIEEPSGIFYQNQVGGTMCLQKGVEGVLVLVEDGIKRVYNKIKVYTMNLDHLEEKDADYIDSLFIEDDELRNYMRVDRSKLEESTEAWIHVVFEQGLPKLETEKIPNLLFSGFDNKKGILTWDNSD